MNYPPHNAADRFDPASNIFLIRSLVLTSTLALLPIHSASAVWITNYTSLSPGMGGSASGVWREVMVDNTGAGFDTGFVVSLTTSGEVKSVADATHPSEINEGFPWRDLDPGDTYNGLPVIAPVSLPFYPQVNGDFANIETDGMASSIVTFNFGAQITNPVLSFSDVDIQSDLVFTNSFSILTGTGNLMQSGNILSNSGSGSSIADEAIFGEEAAGSIQFTGTFTQLQFTVNNAGPDPQDDDDRTGYVVTTEFAPVAVPEPSAALSLILGALACGLRRRK
ncbi:PEP-CTERM sorting domain-containing protein [Verrucomicrobiaceae bacterium 5K15]|uniref:PEP-CTERM sorting domain-containing protein n=1 Tax=Oceaniferula flava TaxID=2800421 RepID=A0AAE2SD21_9BACT|nr:PEP-CTERM sorting domain-containing protein [Oceaniferula flavus]MBK1855157.1 PEP-CTERM sorting domain-containing protein [Oceaniferula flavus]MBM1136463.1 PEP-CTERM sorting domain-containing protein [Oceaniferula flavus]